MSQAAVMERQATRTKDPDLFDKVAIFYVEAAIQAEQAGEPGLVQAADIAADSARGKALRLRYANVSLAKSA